MIHTRLLKAFAFVVFVAAGTAAAQDKIAHIGPSGEIKKAHTGFKFTEGPACDGDGNVYFSDIPNEKIHKIDASGKLSVFREKSNVANGLMVNAKGEIVARELSGAIVALSADGEERRVICDKYEGNRFNAPNDLVIDKAGGVYFTDPSFRAPTPLPQNKTCVYYVDASGKVTRLIDDLPNPNGVRLSPDEKTVYVFRRPEVTDELSARGQARKGKCSANRLSWEGGNGGGDGGTIDEKGNVYIAAGTGPGLRLIRQDARHDQFEHPSNATFGGKDMKTLFVSAPPSLCPMETRGTVIQGSEGNSFFATEAAQERPLCSWRGPPSWRPNLSPRWRRSALAFVMSSGPFPSESHVVVDVYCRRTLADDRGRVSPGRTLIRG